MIRDVIFPTDIEELRALILEYLDWLSIDLSYQDFEGEMASLEALFSLACISFFWWPLRTRLLVR